MTATRFGLVGYGSGGRVFHAPLLASAEGVEFAGVLTRPLSAGPSWRRRIPASRRTTRSPSWPPPASRRSRSPPRRRPTPTLAREAIGLGLAVVVDKPFALDAEAAREVVAAAAAGRRAAERVPEPPLGLRPADRAPADRRGELGEVRRFESRFERWAPDPGPPAAGGGTLLDFGSHLVDQAYCCSDRPPGCTRKCAARRTRRRRVRGPAPRRAASSRTCGAAGGRPRRAPGCGSPAPPARTSSTGSTARRRQLKAGRTPADLGDALGRRAGARLGPALPGRDRRARPSERGRWDTFYPAFAAAVRGEAPVPVDPCDSVRSMDVLDAARISARTGETVGL